MQNRFVKTKFKKRSIYCTQDWKRLPEQANIFIIVIKKIAQILNIDIRIIALIRKGMDVAAEMVTIKNLL